MLLIAALFFRHVNHDVAISAQSYLSRLQYSFSLAVGYNRTFGYVDDVPPQRPQSRMKQTTVIIKAVERLQYDCMVRT